MILVLLAAGALLGYCLLCLASPVAKCPRTRTVSRKGKRPRVIRCPRCKGMGLRQRPAARLVHGFFWSVTGSRSRAYLSRHQDGNE